MTPLSYKDAGVDLDLYAQAMGRLPALMTRTHGPRVIPLPGGFAGLFKLQDAAHQYRDPVLVSGTDGVGTKIKVAQRVGRYDTIGIDLVAMCVNDCLCLGAEPLFFLDYLAIGRDDPDLVEQLVTGVSEGCRQAGAALLGGETAVMPDLYAAGDFDMAGFCTGVVEKDQVIDGSRIQAGDLLIGLASTGLHSNGYSLVRKVVFDHAGLDVDESVAELGQTVGEALLTPTRIYADVVSSLIAGDEWRAGVTGIAHITGGGLEENVSRLLTGELKLAINHGAWTVPTVFGWLQRLGGIEPAEMNRVFNMGIGLVLVVRPELADRLAELPSANSPVVIGEVVQAGG